MVDEIYYNTKGCYMPTEIRPPTSDVPADVNYYLTRLQGQLVRLAEVNTKGRHLYSDEELHKEIAAIVNTAQGFATSLRLTFDRKRFDVA